MFSVAYSVRFIHQVFFGPSDEDLPRAPREPTRGMLVPSALLVIACLLVGVLPEQTIGPLLETAAHAILGADTPVYELAAWHGLTRPLVMSLVALGGGVAFYLFLHPRGRTMVRTPLLSRLRTRARTFDIVNVR